MAWGQIFILDKEKEIRAKVLGSGMRRMAWGQIFILDNAGLFCFSGFSGLFGLFGLSSQPGSWGQVGIVRNVCELL
jgi:hypothetical protein